VNSIPYDIIAAKLKTGTVIPFLGAGASLGARQPADSKFDPRNPRFLPNARELAAALANESAFPSDDPYDRSDLAKVCSYYAGVAGDRKTLRQRLRDLLHPNHTAAPEPMKLHRLLASLPAPQVIVTTNYDSLIEDAFDKAGKPYDLVIYPADRPADYVNSVIWWPHGGIPQAAKSKRLDEYLDLRTTKTTVIFKMHGTRHPSDQTHDHFVITEEDYVEFLSRMTTRSAIPPIFYPRFRECSFLFLGYGLRDWNLRVLLKNLPNQTDDQLRSWAIQKAPSNLESKLWQKRNVEIYDVTLDEFADETSGRLDL
jgi:hypothetical protein